MEILGLPLHPLVIHAVVILVPLVAIGGIAIATLGWARKRYGTLVLVGAFGALASTITAQVAGQALFNSRQQWSAAAQAHAAIGTGLLLWVILLFIGVGVVVLAQWMIEKDRPQGRIALIAGSVVTIVCGVISVVQVVRIGHAGATAVWGS